MSGLSRNTLWVKCSKPNPQACFRLFCFPYAGGGASLFRNWANRLPGEVEVCAVQLPGREDRLAEPAFTRMLPLIEALASALSPYLQDKPCAFFGHSMGAFVSFELARYLRKHHTHAGPLQLFVSAQRAPQLPDPEPPIHALPDNELIEELRDLNGTPTEILQNVEVLELTLPLLRADFAICETYHFIPGAPLLCPIFACGGIDDKDIDREKISAWREQTQGSFTLRMFPGDHFFLHRSQTELLQAIYQQLTSLLRYAAQRYG
ncbi:MAG TPA: thioesterase II family protein [Ktedonobacteraceae bacterium]|nr:thioesterase II family protein [Ktedonobacteraceae bacterium]